MAIKSLTNIVNNMLSNVTHQVFLPEIKEASKDKQSQNTDANQIQRMHILLRQNFIDNVLDNPRNDNVTESRKSHTDDGNGQLLLIRNDKSQQPLVAVPTIVLLHGVVSPLQIQK